MLELVQPNKSIIQQYLDLGFKLIFWPRDLGKGPRDPSWPQKAIEGYYDINQYHEGMNVGVLLGHEISPGRFLVDIDFDWPVQATLAGIIFEKTGFQFGHRSKKYSHLFYTAANASTSAKYLDPITKTCIVEYRCTKEDGTLGLQTVIPPSVHSPTGELIEFDENTGIAHDEHNVNEHRVKLYAAAYVLYKKLQNQLFHHEHRLATVGFLLESGLNESDVLLITEALCRACGNDVKDAKLCVQTTAAKHISGKTIKGRSTLISLLGEDGNTIVLGLTKILGGSWFITDGKDKISAQNTENIRIALEKLKVTLTFNEFAQEHIITDNGVSGPLQDPHMNRLWLEIDSKYHFRPTKDLFQTVILDEGWQHKFHPVKNYLNTLVWDQIPRLDTWLIDCAKAADTPYHRAISALMLIAAVRRIKVPGAKFDEMVILESPQGYLKSSALKMMCPEESWFSDDLPLDADTKIVMEKTKGKWILEAAELSGMRYNKVEHLKAFLSRSNDHARMAYDRMTTNVYRQWIVVGTTNAHVYLKDTTSNRRFWPMRVQRFNLKHLKEIRDQLWAEAAFREEAGESIRLPESLYAVAELQQERRRETDPWEEAIKDIIVLEKRYRFTIKELWTIVNIPIEQQTKIQQSRLSEIMTREGFRRGMARPKAGGLPARGWVLDRPGEENFLPDPDE